MKQPVPTKANIPLKCMSGILQGQYGTMVSFGRCFLRVGLDSYDKRSNPGWARCFKLPTLHQPKIIGLKVERKRYWLKKGSKVSSALALYISMHWFIGWLFILGNHHWSHLYLSVPVFPWVPRYKSRLAQASTGELWNAAWPNRAQRSKPQRCRFGGSKLCKLSSC